MQFNGNTGKFFLEDLKKRLFQTFTTYYMQVFLTLSNLSIFQVMSLQILSTLIKISKWLQVLVAKFLFMPLRATTPFAFPSIT